jgi:hypothetical protein
VPAEAKEFLAVGTAMQRLGDPDEIAKTVLFLASDAASFITGTEIIVDNNDCIRLPDEIMRNDNNKLFKHGLGFKNELQYIIQYWMMIIHSPLASSRCK